MGSDITHNPKTDPKCVSESETTKAVSQTSCVKRSESKDPCENKDKIQMSFLFHNRFAHLG